MNLLEKLQNAVAPLPFIHWDLMRANNKLNNTKLPCVVTIRNPNSQLINQNGNYVEQTDFLLLFVEHTKWDLTSIENEAIIEQMTIEAVKFIRKVKKDNVFSIIGGYRIQKFYEYMDANVTGAGLAITLRENFGNLKCFKND